MQTTTLEEYHQEIPNGLALCRACDHVVPDVIICLWCGSKLKGGESV